LIRSAVACVLRDVDQPVRFPGNSLETLTLVERSVHDVHDTVQSRTSRHGVRRAASRQVATTFDRVENNELANSWLLVLFSASAISKLPRYLSCGTPEIVLLQVSERNPRNHRSRCGVEQWRSEFCDGGSTTSHVLL